MIKKQFIAVVLSLAGLLIVYYALLPVIAFNFYETWFLIFAALFFCLFLSFAGKGFPKLNWMSKVILLLLVVCIAVIGIGFISSTVLLNTNKYRDLLGKVEKGKFNADMEPISTSEIRIIDEESAERIGSKLLGSEPALGSRVIVGEYTLQRVKDHLYWVAPLLHTGFWQWRANDGTPGFVMVSATNAQDAALVEQVAGQPVKIKYQPEAYFGDNLERHIRFNGYMHIGLTDVCFEVDDNLHPYWVVSTYHNQINFDGPVVNGILVVNPATGEIKQYTPETAPAWIDRIQPAGFVMNQINDWGDLVNGYWNFSKTGKLKVTDESLSLVYGADGRCYFYTGVTSVGKDDGTIGFMLIDSRTKRVRLYDQAGAIESAAQKSAEGKVQQMGYRASYPIMYNLEGLPTYVMALKDKGGLVKGISMVNVADYSIVGSGADIEEALNDYKAMLVSKGNRSLLNGAFKQFNFNDVVERINSATINGNTQYYLVLRNSRNKIFIGRVSLSSKFPITQAGDSVNVSFTESKNFEINLSGFDNLKYQFEKSGAQIKKDHYFDSVDSVGRAKNVGGKQ